MNAIKKYGLIGHSLQHSFSKKYFEEKFNQLGLNYSYELIELEDENSIPDLLSKQEMDGFNVTIPYKQKIANYLDELDDSAKKIGAVNTVVFKKGKYKGYNTDVHGFDEMINHLPTDVERALVLGSGGASKAVQYVFSKRKIPFMIVSRTDKHKSENPYVEVNELNLDLFNTIINASPLGMYPNIQSYPDIPYDKLTTQHMLLDLVYNPEETQFMKLGKNAGTYTMNGLKMLYQQADKAWELWNQA